ncbi:MAG: ATP:cob(I)alamin adenosyltransferase [Treponema sp.]|jgi:cob(I)alamin adenosyltransferase|nr:ATP:cob(I)alamin adenosyltransferase [Treponema sp.]
MSITTKTGDGGHTDLIGGIRVSKDHPVMECLGALDELNAFLGAAKAALREKDPRDEKVRPGADAKTGGPAADTGALIESIQKELFVISGLLAGSGAKAPPEGRLSAIIEELESAQQPFAGFAVPGANPVSAHLHIARTICRRAERRLAALGCARENSGGASPKLPPGILPYFNRLSDLLFLLAQREAGHGLPQNKI